MGKVFDFWRLILLNVKHPRARDGSALAQIIMYLKSKSNESAVVLNVSVQLHMSGSALNLAMNDEPI